MSEEQHDNATYLISNHDLTDSIFGQCPCSSTMVAFSETFRRQVFIVLPCELWSCRPCSENKVRRIAYKVNKAKPNRLLTLTVDPSLWENPRDAFDGTRDKVSKLCRKLRTRFGEVEYLRVTELTGAGWPHYHLLVRSGYLPHPVVKDHWNKLTGASIVDLRMIHNRFKTYTYLVKYLAKMHNLGWTNRHMSHSRGFFRKEEEQQTNSLQLRDKSMQDLHLCHYLHMQYPDDTVELIARGVFALNRSEAPFAAGSSLEYQTDF